MERAVTKFGSSVEKGRGNTMHLNKDEEMEGADTLAGRADAPPREDKEEGNHG